MEFVRNSCMLHDYQWIDEIEITIVRSFATFAIWKDKRSEPIHHAVIYGGYWQQLSIDSIFAIVRLKCSYIFYDYCRNRRNALYFPLDFVASPFFPIFLAHPLVQKRIFYSIIFSQNPNIWLYQFQLHTQCMRDIFYSAIFLVFIAYFLFSFSLNKWCHKETNKHLLYRNVCYCGNISSLFLATECYWLVEDSGHFFSAWILKATAKAQPARKINFISLFWIYIFI